MGEAVKSRKVNKEKKGEKKFGQEPRTLDIEWIRD